MGQSTHKAENQETLIQRCSAEYLSFQIETNFDMSAASKLQHIRRAITSARSANLKKSWTILQEEEAFLPETRLPKISASILSHSYHSHWKVLFPRPVALGSLAQSLSRPASPQPPSQDLRRPYLPIERSLSQSSLARRHFFRLSFPPTLLPKDPALELSLLDDLLQTYPS
jgi:hypothetical protein